MIVIGSGRARSAGLVIDASRVPGREWQWNHGPWGHDGVHTHDGKLEWFAFRQDEGEVARTSQSFESFLTDGARHAAPAEVLEDLQVLVMSAVR